MKKILLLIGLAVIAVSARAQVPNYGAQNLGVTNNVVAATTNAETKLIDCRKQNTVGVMLNCAAVSSTTGTTTFTYYRSLDGTTFESTGNTVTQTENGTNIISTFTNLNTYGCGFIKFSIANTNAAIALTNLSIVYGVKISAP